MLVLVKLMALTIYYSAGLLRPRTNYVLVGWLCFAVTNDCCPLRNQLVPAWKFSLLK